MMPHEGSLMCGYPGPQELSKIPHVSTYCKNPTKYAGRTCVRLAAHLTTWPKMAVFSKLMFYLPRHCPESHPCPWLPLTLLLSSIKYILWYFEENLFSIYKYLGFRSYGPRLRITGAFTHFLGTVLKQRLNTVLLPPVTSEQRWETPPAAGYI